MLFVIIVKQIIITFMNNHEIKESAYIQYLDFNNQCRGALSQPILYGGLESVEYILMFMHDFLNYSRNSNFGYTLIVDVDYVEYLQSLHND